MSFAFKAAVVGGAGLAAFGAYEGLRHQEIDEDPVERAKAGVLATGVGVMGLGGLGAAGAAGYFALRGFPSARRIAGRALTGPFGMAAMGATAGAVIGGEDHRGMGAAVGATAAVGLRYGIPAAYRRIRNGPSKMGSMKKLGLFGLGLAAVGVAGASLNRPAALELAGVDDGGETAYVDPSRVDTGVKRRMRKINAGGDMVFGLHNGRH